MHTLKGCETYCSTKDAYIHLIVARAQKEALTVYSRFSSIVLPQSTMACNSNDVHGGDDNSFVLLFALSVSVMTIVISITVKYMWVCIVNCVKQPTQVQHNDVAKDRVNTAKTVQTIATQTVCQISYADRTQQSSGIEEIYVTKFGERWHKNRQCKHLQRHPAKLLTPCCDCTRG